MAWAFRRIEGREVHRRGADGAVAQGAESSPGHARRHELPGRRRAPLLRRTGRGGLRPVRLCAWSWPEAVDVSITAAVKALAAAHRLGGRTGRGRHRRPPARQDQGSLALRGGPFDLRRRARAQPGRLARPDRPAAVRGPAARGPQRGPAPGRPWRRGGGAGGLLAASGRCRCAGSPEEPAFLSTRSGRPRKRTREAMAAVGPGEPVTLYDVPARLAAAGRGGPGRAAPRPSSTTGRSPRSPCSAPATLSDMAMIGGVGQCQARPLWPCGAEGGAAGELKGVRRRVRRCRPTSAVGSFLGRLATLQEEPGYVARRSSTPSRPWL